MDEKHLTRFRTDLTARRAKAGDTLARLQQELRNPVVRQADSADQASASFDKNALHHEAEQASRHIRLLDEALKRIAEGAFGQCAMCGNDIGLRRLDALPWARFCVSCQEFQENLR